MSPTDIQDAIIATLAPALKAEGLAYAVDTFAGDIGELETWIGGARCPSVGVFYQDSTFAPADASGRLENVTDRFEIWVIHSRLRGIRQAMYGEAGVVEILARIGELLKGQRLGLGIDPIRRVVQGPVDKVELKVIYRLVVETSYKS